MKTNIVTPANIQSLRFKAEEILKQRSVSANHLLSEAGMLKLIHEFEVHQIEQELQNEELRSAISSAKEATDLYDFAPSGYFTLSGEGKIIRANLSGKVKDAK